MDFEPCFKVYNLVSIRPKSMKLGQMTNLNKIFHMVGSVYRLVTIGNSPQFPFEFRNGLLNVLGVTRTCICGAHVSYLGQILLVNPCYGNLVQELVNS